MITYDHPDVQQISAVMAAIEGGGSPPLMPDGSNALGETVRIPGREPKLVRDLTVADFQAIAALFREIARRSAAPLN
jgi:hypothetical protein